MMHSVTVLAAAGFSLGGYISVMKLVPVVVLFLLWAKLIAWADKDAVAAHLPREWLNSGLFFGGIAGFALFFFLPGFIVAFSVTFVVFLASVGTYLFLRNQQVGLADLKGQLAELKNLGRKKKVTARVGEVLFQDGKGKAIAPPEAETPERPGYDAAQDFMTEPLRKEAEKVTVRPGEGGNAAVHFTVDGVAYAASPMDKNAAAAGIVFLKQAAGLNVEDKRKPQTGTMKATLDNKRHDLEVTTAGTTAGESMQVVIDAKKRWEHRLDTIGLTPEQMSAVQASIQDRTGIVLVSAPKQQGLTTTLYSLIRAHDAFLQHLQTIERAPREDLEGVAQNRLAPNASPTEEFKLVEWVCSQQPDVILVDEVINPDSAKELIRFVGEGTRRVYIGMRSASTFDAVNEWRKLVGDDEMAVRGLSMALNGRILRKLCMACKVAYQPEAEKLRKLNMDPAKVTKLYEARTSPLLDPKGRPIPCNFCYDLRYKTRFGVFELFSIDDEVRQIVAGGGSPNQIKTAFRKQRGRYLQEVALAKVEAGDTSIQEVLRVLRGAEQRPSGNGGAGGAAIPSRPAVPSPAAGKTKQAK